MYERIDAMPMRLRIVHDGSDKRSSKIRVPEFPQELSFKSTGYQQRLVVLREVPNQVIFLNDVAVGKMTKVLGSFKLGNTFLVQSERSLCTKRFPLFNKRVGMIGITELFLIQFM